MLELTKEQMEVIQKAISKKAEESVQEFDKELDIVVSKLSTEGWTLPAELNILRSQNNSKHKQIG